MATTPDGPARPNPPRQARSRRTHEKIVSAAAGLLEEEGPGGLTVAGIAARAGVSVGGFYARFPSKDALLAHLYDREVDGELARAAGNRLDADGGAALPPDELLLRYSRLLLATYREHEGLLREAARRGALGALHAAGGGGEPGEGGEDASGEDASGGDASGGDASGGDAPLAPADARLREALGSGLRVGGAGGDPDAAEAAVEFLLLSLRATAREVVLHGPPTLPGGEALEDEAVAREMSRAGARYLGHGIPSAASRPASRAGPGGGGDDAWSPFDFPAGA